MSLYKKIVLIGFMGTGKSTVGKRLAKLLEWDFIDTDLDVERITGLSVSEIFRRHGEMRFRSEEVLAVRRLVGLEHCVVATGGGTMLDPENWTALTTDSIIIALYASLDTILERVGNKNGRPLLKNNREELENLWLKRQKIYAKAHLTIDTTEKDIEEVADEILNILRSEDYEFTGLAQN